MIHSLCMCLGCVHAWTTVCSRVFDHEWCMCVLEYALYVSLCAFACVCCRIDYFFYSAFWNYDRIFSRSLRDIKLSHSLSVCLCLSHISLYSFELSDYFAFSIYISFRTNPMCLAPKSLFVSCSQSYYFTDIICF